MEHFQQRLVELGKKYQRSVPLDVPAEASILDSLLIPSQGIVFRALIQQGQLSVRDDFICGLYMGRVPESCRSSEQFHLTSISRMVDNVSERGNFLRH